MLATLTLARWLGPWADARAAPIVAIRDDEVDGIRVRLFSPSRSARRTFLIAPGLHYAGPDDPRLDRFCRILAAAGHLVVAPYIPDYLALLPTARAKRDFQAVFRALPRWSPQRPVVFSISFGSLLAFALAAEHGAAIERLVCFGGYADLHKALAFCLTGQVASGRAAARDPLNQPVVMMNLLHLLDCADRPPVAAAWRQFVERTWGRPELKARERFEPIAEELAASVPAGVRDLYRIGVGVTPGAADLALAALARFDASALDPAPYLPRIANRVELVHGVDDDVIPYEHAHALAAALPDARVHLTGLYGHTGSVLPPIASAAKELATMLRVLRVLS
jgi:pimeloyl-ACP methyl ester carboxylesterase